jgi:1,4-dihydroxy-2-naphthoate octaprenyltransferase
MAQPHRLQVWLLAARPKTLPAALAPVLIGTAMAYEAGALHWPSALGCFAFALLAQVGTNLCNDYSDFKKGADTETRQGPVRVTQAGLLSPETVLRGTVTVFTLALSVGLLLVWRGGWPLLVLGAAALAAGVLYTAGPIPYGYLGLGDLFVLIFFGPVAVGGTYYVQALTITPEPIVAGLLAGLLSVAILVVNNLRDRQGDKEAGKRTLAVRFGATFARMEYVLCMIVPLVVPTVYTLATGTHRWLLALWVVAPLAMPVTKTVLTRSDGAALNPALGQTAKVLLLYSVVFSIAWNL